MASWKEFKSEMAQAWKDFESEIRINKASLEFQQENQDDKNLIKMLIIILMVVQVDPYLHSSIEMFVFCLITLNGIALLTEGFAGEHS